MPTRQKKTVQFGLFVMTMSIIMANQHSICSDEFNVPSNINSRTEVSALSIFISFPDVPESYLMPTWTQISEQKLETYYQVESYGEHDFDMQTIYQPSPDEELCYMTDYNSTYYTSIMEEYGFSAGLGALNDEIIANVHMDYPNIFDSINVVFMNYNTDSEVLFNGFSALAYLGSLQSPYYNGSGTSNTVHNDQNTYEWTIAHEYGHLLGAPHHWEGIYCQMDGKHWRIDEGAVPYCIFKKRELGWVDDSKFPLITTNTYGIVIEPTYQGGNVYEVTYDSTSFFIENHQGYGNNEVYPATGLLIWRGSRGNGYEMDKDILCADGAWNWVEAGCWGEDLAWEYPFIQTTENPSEGYDEIDMRRVKACNSSGGQILGYHPDLVGDVDDFFNVGWNTLLADWTNPNSISRNGEFSDISIETVGQNGDNITVNILTNTPPLAPTNLVCYGNVGDHPLLSWDPNSEPDVDEYLVFRKRTAQDPDFVQIETVSVPFYEDEDVTITTKMGYMAQGVHYKIKAVDDFPQESANYSNTAYVIGEGGHSGEKQLAGNSLIPEDYYLSVNYPNPFNPSTYINYSLPERSVVSLIVYNFEGREVARLVDEIQSASYKSLTWNGVDSQNLPVASGVYIYKMEAKSLESEKTFSKNMKMTLLK